MSDGALRIDANISVRPLGTDVLGKSPFLISSFYFRTKKYLEKVHFTT